MPVHDIHLLGVGQLGSRPPSATAQTPLVGLDLSTEDGQLDLLVVDLEDGCEYSTLSVKDSKRHLGTQLINLHPVGAHPPIHNVLSTRKLHVCHELAFFTFFSLLFYCIDTCCYSPSLIPNTSLHSLSTIPSSYFVSDPQGNQKARVFKPKT